MNDFSNKQAVLLGFITLAGLGGLGLWFLSLSTQLNVKLFFLGNPEIKIYWQILLGVISGVIFAIIAQYIVTRPFFAETKTFYDEMLGQLNVNFWGMFFISISAGIGEEIFFRGFVQYWLGLFLTAVIFVVLHGYLNPEKKALFKYGLFVTAFSVLLGIFAKYIGILAAMSAHFAFDFVLLLFSAQEEKQNPEQPTPPSAEAEDYKPDNHNSFSPSLSVALLHLFSNTVRLLKIPCKKDRDRNLLFEE